MKKRSLDCVHSLITFPVAHPVYIYLWPVVAAGEKWHRIKVWRTEWPRYVMMLVSPSSMFLALYTAELNKRWSNKVFIDLNFTLRLTSFGHSLPSVIPVLCRYSFTSVWLCVFVRECSDVPQFDRLVFAVGNQVPTVPSWVYVCYTVHVTCEDTHRVRVRLAQGSPVPYLKNIEYWIIRSAKDLRPSSHLAETVVTCAVQYLWSVVREGYGIYIVRVTFDLQITSRC